MSTMHYIANPLRSRSLCFRDPLYSMKKHLTKNNIVEIAVFLFYIFTPLIAAMLFCLKDGRVINDIYIPLGGWSDEITYYKQIEGILSHGMPRGYFGYNQSRAMYGTLGVWGLVPLIPYILWGFFFGWNYCSPLYANIFFCIIALIVTYVLLRPKKMHMCTISLFWITNQFLNRYVLSGVIEASIFMQLMVVTACGQYLLSETLRSNSKRTFSLAKDRFALILCTTLICFLTLARPYFAVLYLIPFWFAVKNRKKVWIFGLPALAMVIMILFFLNNHYFCATYFESVLSFDHILSAGFGGLLYQILESFVEIARLIWYALRYKGSGVGWYYLLLCIELAVMFFTCIYRKWRHREVPKMYVITLIGNALILLSIIIMYDLGVGARHILALTTANAVVIIIETHFSWGLLLAAVCLFSHVQTQGADGLPYKNNEYVTYMDNLKETFSQIVEVTSDISYENVVAMPTADHHAANPEQGVVTYYGLLFAMPAGVGISLDFEDYYFDSDNIKAGYILVHPEGKIRNTLESINMHCIFENEEFALYAN